MSDASIDQLTNRVAAAHLHCGEPALSGRIVDARDVTEKPRSYVRGASGTHESAGHVGEERNLSEADIERIAQRTAELVATGDGASSRIVDAATVARELAVSVDYVYEHQRELGAIKLPGGRNAPLRFDLAAILRLAHEQPKLDRGRSRGRGRPKERDSNSGLLPIKRS
jgi:hypothetical protein